MKDHLSWPFKDSYRIKSKETLQIYLQRSCWSSVRRWIHVSYTLMELPWKQTLKTIQNIHSFYRQLWEKKMGGNIHPILLYNLFLTPHLILGLQNFRPLIPPYVPFAIQLSIEIDLLRIVNSCSFVFNFSTDLMCKFFYKLQEGYFTLPLQVIATLQKMIIQ